MLSFIYVCNSDKWVCGLQVQSEVNQPPQAGPQPGLQDLQGLLPSPSSPHASSIREEYLVGSSAVCYTQLCL